MTKPTRPPITKAERRLRARAARLAREVPTLTPTQIARRAVPIACAAKRLPATSRFVHSPEWRDLTHALMSGRRAWWRISVAAAKVHRRKESR